METGSANRDVPPGVPKGSCHRRGAGEKAMALTGRECGHQYRPDVPAPDRPRRLRGLLIGLATFLAAGGITAAVMLIAHPLQRGATPSPGGTTSTPASASPVVPSAQQAAAQ